MSRVKKWLLGILIILFLFLHLIPVKSVIVSTKISPPWQAEGYLSEAEKTIQRQSIAETDRAVINVLRFGGFGAYDVKQFKYIPGFSATVSINAYLLLRLHPSVKSIGEDLLAVPQASAIP